MQEKTLLTLCKVKTPVRIERGEWAVVNGEWVNTP